MRNENESVSYNQREVGLWSSTHSVAAARCRSAGEPPLGCLISLPQQVSFVLPLLITAAGAEGKCRERRGLSSWALIRCGAAAAVAAAASVFIRHLRDEEGKSFTQAFPTLTRQMETRVSARPIVLLRGRRAHQQLMDAKLAPRRAPRDTNTRLYSLPCKWCKVQQAFAPLALSS